MVRRRAHGVPASVVEIVGHSASVPHRPAKPNLLDIATVNLWNRLNIATQQVAGEYGG